MKRKKLNSYELSVVSNKKLGIGVWGLGVKLFVLLFIVSRFIGIHCFSQVGVGINTTGAAADHSALLDVSSTTQGVLVPRMTSGQRDAIVSPANSLLIYNTTTQCFEGYNAATSAWVSFGCIGCQLPGAFTATAATDVAGKSFSANWTASAGATTYYIDVNTNSSFTGTVILNNQAAGSGTTYSVTGLNYSTIYYYRVRANNACGTSDNSNTITVTTSAFSCPSTLTINHIAGVVAPVTKTVIYGVVSTTLTGVAKCWITQNLGSDRQATAATDNTEASAGWYWQFNRKQGYKHDGTTRTPSTTWISSISENFDWTSANDPCTIELGAGWRIPTSTNTSGEWFNADANGAHIGGGTNWQNYNDTYADVLKLHAAGYLSNSDGTLGPRGIYDNNYYWSSMRIGGAAGWDLILYNTGCSATDSNAKAFGYPLRCIRD